MSRHAVPFSGIVVADTLEQAEEAARFIVESVRDLAKPIWEASKLDVESPDTYTIGAMVGDGR